MKHALWISSLLLLSLPSLAQNQGTLNAQADREFRQADKELNAAYQELSPKLGPEARRALVTAQQAWVKFRDADAQAHAEAYHGGSMAPMVYSNQQKQDTVLRCRQLREWLKELADR